MSNTPGPWIVVLMGKDDPLQIRSTDTEIAALSYINGPEKDDAALIAAAPDMKNALEKIIMHLSPTDKALAQAALDKAKP